MGCVIHVGRQVPSTVRDTEPEIQNRVCEVRPEHVNGFETHLFTSLKEQLGVVGGVTSFLDGLIQTVSGTLGGRGVTPLKRAGWAAKAASSVTPRCAVSAVDRP